MSTATATRRRVDWYALVTFALASLWFFGIGSLAALVAGHRSLRRMKTRPELRGRVVAWAGIAVALLGLAFTAL
jgi:hypothetical protein